MKNSLLVSALMLGAVTPVTQVLAEEAILLMQLLPENSLKSLRSSADKTVAML